MRATGAAANGHRRVGRKSQTDWGRLRFFGRLSQPLFETLLFLKPRLGGGVKDDVAPYALP